MKAYMTNVNALLATAQNIIDSGSFGALVSAAATAAKPTTATKISAVIPDFNSYAKKIVSVQGKADKAAGNASNVISQSIQKYLDACIVSGLARDVQNAHAIKDAIGDCQVFIDAVAVGIYQRNTITAYAQGAMRAFFHDVDWTPTLQNDPELKVPSKSGKVRASGTTTTTKVTREQLDKTLNKALAQMRELTLDDTAAELLDFLLDNLTGFAESADI